MDSLLDSQLTATDPAERAEIFHAISNQLVGEQVWIPLYYQKLSFANNKRVSGFDPDYRGFSFNAEDWSR
jgi:peptide/nickel transport system substrate-binding protein